MKKMYLDQNHWSGWCLNPSSIEFWLKRIQNS